MEKIHSTNSVPALGPNREEEESSSSLTLSITPPLSDAPISEHFSVENDRSLQEIEIPDNFSLLLPLDEVRLSQEPRPSFNSSFNSSMENNVKSILEEILSNEQFKSESEMTDLDIFANINLDDRVLNPDFNLNDSIRNFDDVFKRVNDLEELISVKETTIEALQTELDSLRELVSNPSSSFGTNTTEYKQFQEECHNKLVEFHDAIIHKDEQIEKLTTSLQQSIVAREEMKQHFKNEVNQLQEQLVETSKLLREHKCHQNKDFTEIVSKIEDALPDQSGLVNDLNMAVECHLRKRIEESKRNFSNEIENLKIKLESDRRKYEEEIAQLQNLLLRSDEVDDVGKLRLELDAKHSKEMEELRTYFEKKCVDLEKNYSEEIFSHQSRKLSGSSSCSDAELPPDFIFNQVGPGGDTKPAYTRKDLLKIHQDLSQILLVFNNFNLSDLPDDDFEKLKDEIHKCDFKNLLKIDFASIQNKYHAELEILREDFDNRVDVLNVEHENKLRDVEGKYREEIEDLNVQLRGRISTTVQEVANSGEFEIDEVVQSYERRLQEQVTLAKIDIIAALESQIQRLVSSENLDDDWSEELLQLKQRFSEKYRSQIDRLKLEHEQEISKLKEEHVKNLNSALERARRRSLRDDSLSKTEIELLEERDGLKKQNLNLKKSLAELCKYFTQCEEELNNTIIEELLNKTHSPEISDSFTKRVHITPNLSEILNLIDSSQNDNESINLRGELGVCLEKLKSDANAILALSNNVKNDSERVSLPLTRSNSIEKDVSSITRKLINETQIKNELIEQLDEAKEVIKSLEGERGLLENQVENFMERQKVLEEDLLSARGKIAELIENGHKEIVSEGYGEDGHKSVKGMENAVGTLRELQEKTRNVAENAGSLDQNILHLLEDLARIGEKVVEEASKDCDDLKQQVESLEQQLRDSTKSLEEAERRCGGFEEELKAAVEKIFELRDIISLLEEQLKSKTAGEEELRNIVNELEVIVKQQESSRSDSNRPGDVPSVEDLHRYIGDLEGEVQRLRLTTEIAGSEGALQQIKNLLCDFENTLDKRTKDLEGLHSTLSTTCSSPSEDMSIRDVVHPNVSNVYDECEVPLQQLARLREKLVRHSRAEDAAMKRTRDLELQICGLKSEFEECQGERDMLKKQISDHIVLISNLQIRLDEQRIRAEHIEKQTNTSLEVQNYDLKHTIVALDEKIAKRDKTIAQLHADIDETKKRLEDREKELSSNPEAEIIAHMQEQLEMLRAENLKLKSKINHEGNENKTEKLLEFFSSWNLDERELEVMNQLRLAGVSFSDLLDLSNSERVRRAEPQESLQLSQQLLLKNPNDTPEPEISRIEKVHPNLFHSLQTSIPKHVHFEDEVAGTKIVDLEKELETKSERIKDLEGQLKSFHDLEKELQSKVEVIKDLEARLNSLHDLEAKVGQLQEKLDETEEVLKETTKTFEENQEKGKNVRLELAAKKVELDEKDEELEAHRAKVEEAAMQLEAKTNEVRELEARSKILREEISELKSNRASKIDELRSQLEDARRDFLHSQHLLVEKDKIISQMSEDSKSLHVNLETIQAKLQETGNVIDLGRKLREEQKKNSELLEELHDLKVQLLSVEGRELDDIAGQVQKELDYSAYLDSTLIGAISDSSIDNQDVAALQLAIKKQKAVNKQLSKAKETLDRRLEDLERKHEELKLILQESQVLLEKERRQLKYTQLEDARLIEQLRIRLDGAIEDKAECEKHLEEEKRERCTLEDQIQNLKIQIANSTDSSTAYKEIDQQEKMKSLKRELSILTNAKSELENELKELRLENGKNVKYNRDLIGLKNDEIAKLESKVSGFLASEQTLRVNLAKVKAELKEKSREVENSKRMMDEMEGDRRAMKKQMDQLNQRVKMMDSGLPLPEQLMEKIRELRSAVMDNMQLVDIISRLTNEKQVLEDRILQLEDQQPSNLPFDDPAARANYLFAKYLRSESYRKALIWQKRYLVYLLESYQNLENETLQNASSRKTTGVKRFRSVVLAVIAVNRMQFLVRRWHSGKRIVQQRNKTQFQVGQPVSSQNFANTPTRSGNVRFQLPQGALNRSHADMSWFGDSPPSKDTARPSSQPPLNSPGLLSNYLERFNHIQERLGLDANQ